MSHVTVNRLLRWVTRSRRVPEDQEIRQRIGTWAWLRGRDIWRPSHKARPSSAPVQEYADHPEFRSDWKV